MVKDQRVSTEVSRSSSPQSVYETLCPHSSRAMRAFDSYARYSTPTRVVKLLAVSKKFLHKYPSPRPSAFSCFLLVRRRDHKPKHYTPCCLDHSIFYNIQVSARATEKRNCNADLDLTNSLSLQKLTCPVPLWVIFAGQGVM